MLFMVLAAPYLLHLTYLIISLVGGIFIFGGISAEAESLCCRLDALFFHAPTYLLIFSLCGASFPAFTLSTGDPPSEFPGGEINGSTALL